MAYKALITFKDKNTGRVYKKSYIYSVSDLTDERLNELTSDDNALEKPVFGESEYPKHTGGGYYELSNGEKVQGKDEAIEAENKLKSGE